jgi:hypothetical protein
MMPLLFVIAGISSSHALQNRTPAQFIKERVSKLLVPLIFGLLIVIPVQSYLAELFHFGEGSYFNFFTKFGDLTGYTGGFTPGQLWFIAYLFVISLIALPFMLLYKKRGNGTFGAKFPFAVVVLIGILLPYAHMILNISGKSLGEYLALFLFGFFILSRDAVVSKLTKYRWILLGLFAVSWIIRIILWTHEFWETHEWLAVLCVLGFGQKHLNFSGKFSSYMSKAAFGVYIFHQSLIVIAGYFIFTLTDKILIQVPVIMAFSIVFSFALYELCKRVKPLRRMFGLKK